MRSWCPHFSFFNLLLVHCAFLKVLLGFANPPITYYSKSFCSSTDRFKSPNVTSIACRHSFAWKFSQCIVAKVKHYYTVSVSGLYRRTLSNRGQYYCRAVLFWITPVCYSLIHTNFLKIAETLTLMLCSSSNSNSASETMGAHRRWG